MTIKELLKTGLVTIVVNNKPTVELFWDAETEWWIVSYISARGIPYQSYAGSNEEDAVADIIHSTSPQK